MASSDDDLNKLDTLSDDDYLKLLERFHEKVREVCSVVVFSSSCCLRMQIILHFRILIWIKNSDLLQNYLHVYDRLIQIQLICV
jgi:hypothetical protein